MLYMSCFITSLHFFVSRFDIKWCKLHSFIYWSSVFFEGWRRMMMTIPLCIICPSPWFSQCKTLLSRPLLWATMLLFSWVPAWFFSGVGKFVGVARIFLWEGCTFFPQKVDDIFHFHGGRQVPPLPMPAGAHGFPWYCLPTLPSIVSSSMHSRWNCRPFSRFAC